MERMRTLFSKGDFDRNENEDDIRSKHGTEQPESYIKSHPSSPVVEASGGPYPLNCDGAVLVPLETPKRQHTGSRPTSSTHRKLSGRCVVMRHLPEFIAVYAIAPDEPQLKLQNRSKRDDHALLAQAWQAANDEARELGWIV
jgi:hypothetical protein